MGQVRYMSRAQFKKVAGEGNEMGFNRQVAPWVLEKLVQGQSTVSKLMVHEHVNGRAAEPHLRTLVQFKLVGGEAGSAIIDMKAATFDSLPIKTLPPLRGRKKYRLAQPQGRFCGVK